MPDHSSANCWPSDAARRRLVATGKAALRAPHHEPATEAALGIGHSGCLTQNGPGSSFFGRDVAVAEQRRGLTCPAHRAAAGECANSAFLAVSRHDLLAVEGDGESTRSEQTIAVRC